MDRKRYLILAEGFSGDPHYGKTARGVLRYRREDVVALLDSTRAGQTQDGLPIVATVSDALRFDPETALVGVATQGGRFPPAWRELLKSCIRKGLDVESGLHEFLSDDAEISELARRYGVELRDLRKPPPDLNVPTGENMRVPARIVLTVGSECAIGKKTVALELDREARARGVRSQFVPTGQTGIMIAGWGIAVDAVVADFLAGAAERLVVEGARRGGKLLFVEGQGSLAHPAYSGVTLALIHGARADGFVLCHDAARVETDLWHTPIPHGPALRDFVELHERIAALVYPARVVAVALNTAALDEAAARRAVAGTQEESGLPTDDVVRFGADRLLDAVLARTPVA